MSLKGFWYALYRKKQQLKPFHTGPFSPTYTIWHDFDLYIFLPK